MTPDELRRWADNQTKELMALGIDAIEAERSVQWVLDHGFTAVPLTLPASVQAREGFTTSLPPGTDPNTYVFPAEVLDEPLDQAAVDDARTAYYANDAVPAKYKRLLDARLALD